MTEPQVAPSKQTHYLPLALPLVIFLIFSAVGGWVFWLTQDITILLFGAILAGYAGMLSWVYQDARANGRPAFAWMLVVLFLFVLGFAIYLVVRELAPADRDR
jgi:uncharacterized membrane protein